MLFPRFSEYLSISFTSKVSSPVWLELINLVVLSQNKTSIGQSLHLRSYAGILESMYAGVGSEILYEPFGKRWAIGTTINALKQRGFKKFIIETRLIILALLQS